MRRPTIIPLVLVGLWIGTAAAQEKPPSDGSSAASDASGDVAPRVRKVQGANAIRFQIADGLIRLDGETRRARIDLEWNLLPPDSLLRGDHSYETFRIHNRELAARSNEARWGADDRALLEALDGDLDALDVLAWDRTFRSIWGLDSLDASNAWPSFDPLEIYGMLRDHAILRTVLQSRGMVFTLRVGERLSDFEHDDVTWEIRRYTFHHRAHPPRDVFHRYTITARATGIEIRLSGDDAEKIPIQIRARLRECSGESGPCSILEAPEFVFDPETIEIEQSTKKIERLERSQSPSLLETAIEYGTGLPSADIVLQGLRLGSRYASLTGGALISKRNVNPTVGLAFEHPFGDRWGGGVYLGATTSKGGVYAGPNLRIGLLQLSFGALWTERKTDGDSEDSGGGDLDRLWAGVVSLDLPRLFGLKQDLRKIHLSSSAAGGDWGQAADDVMGDLRLARIKLWTEVPDLEWVKLVLERDSLVGGSPALGANRTIVRARMRFTGAPEERAASRLLFLPAGQYQVTLEEPEDLLLGAGNLKQKTFHPSVLEDPDDITTWGYDVLRRGGGPDPSAVRPR